MHGAVHTRVALFAIGAAFLVSCSNDVPSPTELVPSHDVASFTVDKAEFTIAASDLSEEWVTNIASDGVKALVPYSDNLTVAMKLVTVTGTKTAVAMSSPSYGYTFQTAFGDGSYLVAWWNLADGFTWAAKVSAAGTAGAPFRISPSTGSFYPDGIAYAGGKWLVTFYDLTTYKVRGRFVNLNKSLQPMFDVASLAIPDLGSNHVATDGENFLVLYAKSGSTGDVLYAKKVTGAGNVGAATTVETKLDDSYSQFSAGFSHGTYLVTYGKTRSSTGLDVMGRLVTTAGTTNGAAFVVDGGAGDQVALQGVKYGDNFFVTFMNAPSNLNASGRGRTVSNAGVVGPSQTFFTKNNAGQVGVPSVVAIGSKVFFAIDRGLLDTSTDFFPMASGNDLKGAVITP
jgi:hypothetical protein